MVPLKKIPTSSQDTFREGATGRGERILSHKIRTVIQCCCCEVVWQQSPWLPLNLCWCWKTGHYKKEKCFVEVPRPAIIREYNTFMGGVDLLDSLTALYKFGIKSKRWYMYIFYHTLMIAVVNSWLWYKRHAKLLGQDRIMKLSVFQSQIAEALILVNKVGRPRSMPISPPAPKVIRKVPVSDVRLDGCGHLPEWTSDCQRCKNCQSLGQVRCSKCDVYLCFNKNRNCYTQFHSK